MDQSAQPSATDLIANPRRAQPTRAGMNTAVFTAAIAGIILLVGGILFLITRQPAAAEGLVFEIPAGAAQTINQPAIDSAIEIPTRIVFAAGEPAVITVINHDNVTHRAGPFVVAANQTYVQRFPGPGLYPLACAVDPAESVLVEVE